MNREEAIEVDELGGVLQPGGEGVCFGDHDSWRSPVTPCSRLLGCY